MNVAQRVPNHCGGDAIKFEEYEFFSLEEFLSIPFISKYASHPGFIEYRYDILSLPESGIFMIRLYWYGIWEGDLTETPFWMGNFSSVDEPAFLQLKHK